MKIGKYHLPTGPNPADKNSEEKVRYVSNFIHVKVSSHCSRERAGKGGLVLCSCLHVTETESFWKRDWERNLFQEQNQEHPNPTGSR